MNLRIISAVEQSDILVRDGDLDFPIGNLPNELLSGDIVVELDVEINALFLKRFQSFLIRCALADINRFAGKVFNIADSKVGSVADDVLLDFHIAVGEGHLFLSCRRDGHTGGDDGTGTLH